ncbi:hypothetical protein [Azospirillum palustre]
MGQGSRLRAGWCTCGSQSCGSRYQLPASWLTKGYRPFVVTRPGRSTGPAIGTETYGWVPWAGESHLRKAR